MRTYSTKARTSLMFATAALVVAMASPATGARGPQSTPAAGPPQLCQALEQQSVPEPALHVVHQLCA